MFKLFLSSMCVAMALADWTSDWNLDRINPFTSNKQIIPRRDYSTRSSDFERFFSQMDPFPNLSQMMQSGHLPVDIRETKYGIDIQMDLPGVDKQDINVTIHKKNEVRVSAYKHGLIKTDEADLQRVERYSGLVARTLIFPEYADLNRLEAKYEDGVLWIKVPKDPNVPEDEPRSVLVN